MIIRPSFGFFFTMGVLNTLGAFALMLGGYFNLKAQKEGAALLGFVIGSAGLWFAVQLFRKAKKAAHEKRESQAGRRF